MVARFGFDHHLWHLAHTFLSLLDCHCIFMFITPFGVLQFFSCSCNGATAQLIGSPFLCSNRCSFTRTFFARSVTEFCFDCFVSAYLFITF